MTKTIQTLALNVRLSCQLLGVPESSYYNRIKRRPSNSLLRRQRLAQEIALLFKKYKGIY